MPDKDSLLHYAGATTRTLNSRPRPDKGRGVRVIVPQSDYIIKLISEMRMPWLSVVAPWRDNNDDDFLMKMWQTSESAIFLGVRGNLAKCKDLHYEYREKSKLSKTEQEGVNDIFEDGLNPDSFDRSWFFDICNQAIQSGLEGANVDFHSIEGLYCPDEISHIDNRRFKINREIVDQVIWDFILHIQNPVTMEEIPYYDEEGETNFPTLIPMRYKNFEFTLGRGLGDANKFYWDWREAVVEKMKNQIAVEKFSMPFIIISVPDHPYFANNANVDGVKENELLDSMATSVNESGAGSVVVCPMPAKWELMDIGAGKIEPLINKHKSTIERIGNAILGNSGVVMNESMSFGAAQSISMIVVKLISEDREFHYRILNKYLKRMFFNINKKHFQDVKKNIKFRDLPEIKFIADDIDPKNIVEQIKAATAAGYVVTKNFLQENANVEVEDERIQPPGSQGQPGTQQTNKMDSEGRITPDQKSKDNPLITKSNK